MALAPLVDEILGGDLPVAVDAYDGSHAGPPDATTRLVIRSPDALRRIITAPGELGLSRAYVAGEVEVDGEIWDLIALRERLPTIRFSPRVLRRMVEELGGWREISRVDPPREEARLHGRRHTRSRDAAAISHHYDVSNEFYRMVLGPSMTYSCAVFHDLSDTLEEAQANKYELICRKLGLAPGMRLLDIGCGWGGMVMHAAQHHGVSAVGVTISARQAELAEKRVGEAGLSSQVEIRRQDYREVDDGPYDAISSIGMFEHVGEARLGEYFGRLRGLLRPGGRLLNHGISRPPGQRPRLPRNSFANRFVFPDGELHEVGRVVSMVQAAGFEMRHVESLREHYAETLRRWVANLEASWDAAVDEVGAGRARVWRLYMAGSAVNFAEGRTQIHQVLATPSTPDGRSGMPLRPDFG
ncbi:MAG TPA: cyclopropane-fatty-acyl-phospholipid synthase family protein [Acidimicrobiales bacterium]|nr:cyclopropane-fatty-acyl-phospholipid synthase family protein [Acidimicrobiales bacterium]